MDPGVGLATLESQLCPNWLCDMALGHLLDFSMLQFSRLHNKELIRVSHPLSAASLNQITHRELVTPLHWASSMCSLNASYCCPYTINK